MSTTLHRLDYLDVWNRMWSEWRQWTGTLLSTGSITGEAQAISVQPFGVLGKFEDFSRQISPFATFFDGDFRSAVVREDLRLIHPSLAGLVSAESVSLAGGTVSPGVELLGPECDRLVALLKRNGTAAGRALAECAVPEWRSAEAQFRGIVGLLPSGSDAVTHASAAVRWVTQPLAAAREKALDLFLRPEFRSRFAGIALLIGALGLLATVEA